MFVDLDCLEVLRLEYVLVGEVVRRIAGPEVDAIDSELVQGDEVAPERHTLIHRLVGADRPHGPIERANDGSVSRDLIWIAWPAQPVLAELDCGVNSRIDRRAQV